MKPGLAGITPFLCLLGKVGLHHFRYPVVVVVMLTLGSGLLSFGIVFFFFPP